MSAAADRRSIAWGRARPGLAAGLACLLTVSLWGCGSGPPRPPPDPQLRNYNQTARNAYELGRFDQAARLYRQALDRALLRGDTAVIEDTRYNLAASLMQLGQYPEALALLAEAQREADWRQERVSPELQALGATLHYRSGQRSLAGSEARDLLGRDDATDAAVHRALFLLGLMAAEDQDQVGLADALQRMSRTDSRLQQAQTDELRGRLALLEGRYPDAQEVLGESVLGYRQSLDYRSMRRAMRWTAEAYRIDGEPRQATVLLLEAGRSARQTGDLQEARALLQSAASLAPASGDGSLVTAVSQEVALLDSP
jgi:tetratricopeptide (TPR) repeat protein